MPYLRISNIDVSTDSAFYYAILPNYNRKANEVTDWKDPTPIINSFGSGIYTPENGDFTFFRRTKTTGQVDFRNCYINCELSSSVVFVVFQVPTPEIGYHFKVQISMTETGGNSVSSFEYGVSQDNSVPIATWGVSNIFNLNDEGTYYFDVRKIGQTATVGKQAIELYINQDIGNFGGGDESDNTMPGTGSSEG